ncbi:MAG: bifunctional nuclease family protein [Nitrospirota bacterium]
MNIPVKVYAVLTDPNTDAQVVLLRDEQNQLLLPIWVGATEASAIRLTLEGVSIARPLTHDLLKTLLTVLHFRLDKAIINDVNDNTYYAVLYLEEVADRKASSAAETSDRKSFQIDARPSDAIALSLRYGAPLYVAQTIFNESHSQDDLTEWLSRLHPKDFGSFYNV